MNVSVVVVLVPKRFRKN